MEKSLEFVKNGYLGIIDAYKYGFYMLQKHMKNWAILCGSYVGMFIAVALVFGVFIFGIFSSSMNFDTFLDDANFAIDYNVIVKFLWLIFIFIIISMVIGVVFGAVDSLLTTKSYFAEWEITTQKRSFGYFLAKTFKLGIGTFLIFLPIAIIYCILLTASIVISESSIIISVLLGVIDATFYIVALMLLNFLYVALRYEYIVNGNRFGTSFANVTKIIKGNFWEVFGFSFGFNILFGLTVFGASFFMLIPFLNLIIIPIIQVSAMVLLFFGYTIKYMSLKYKNSMDIFPDGFLNEENTRATYQEEATHVSNTTPITEKITPVLEDSAKSEEGSLLAESTVDSNVEKTVVEDEEIYKSIEDITEIKEEL